MKLEDSEQHVQEIKTTERTDRQVEAPASPAEVLREPKHDDSLRKCREDRKLDLTRENTGDDEQ
jgi:hypothetical protein